MKTYDMFPRLLDFLPIALHVPERSFPLSMKEAVWVINRKGGLIMSRTKTTGIQGSKLQWRIKSDSETAVGTSETIRFTQAAAVSGQTPPATIGPVPMVRISMKDGGAEVISQPTPIGEMQATIPVPVRSGSIRPLRASGLSLPLEIGTTVLAQAACLVLMAASLFMPAQNSPTNWWPHLHAGSLAYAVPGVLHNWELFAAAAGFCLLPFFRGEKRSRLMLNVTFSILALMLLAIIQQNMVGATMIILPTIGFLLLAAMNALLAVHVLHPQSKKLASWQIWTAAAVAIFWAVPAIDSLNDAGLQSIFSVNPTYGHDIAIAFSTGAFAAFGSALLALFVPATGFSRTLSVIARTMSACAAMILLGVGFLISAQVSRAFYPNVNSQWFGVGLMWAFLLISACGVLLWAGCVQRFALAATNGHEESPVPCQTAALPA